MHLTLKFGLTALSAMALAACSAAPGEEAGAAERTQAADAPAETEPAAQDAVQDATPAAVTLPPLPPMEKLPCPEGSGITCLGPLVVRAESVNLLGDGAPRSNGSRSLRSLGNLVFENRTESPIRLAIVRGPIDVLFDNGIRLGVARGAVTGIFVCPNQPNECFQGLAGSFQTLVPGDSPARANIGFEGWMDGSLAASLPSVASATITLQVYVVDVNNVGSVLNVSIPNVTVRNQLKP